MKFLIEKILNASKVIFSNTGHYSFALMIIALITGIILSVPFKIASPYNSILDIILNNQIASFIRSVHYWSSQFFLFSTLLHLVDHFLKKSEYDIKFSKWVRLSISIFFIFYLLFSGFLLRDDLDSKSAQNIIANLLNALPFIGFYINQFFFNDINMIYINHISLASILVVIITIEHSKITFPKTKYYLFPTLLTLLFSLIFIPYINIGESGIVKGPYYFQGLQELLNWLSYPSIINYFLISIFVLILILPKVSLKVNSITKKLIYIFFIFYFLLSVIGIFFRGENWKIEFQSIEKMIRQSFLMTGQLINDNKEKISVINGKPESCLNCHFGLKGLNESHNPETIGCSSCHLGNNLVLEKEQAHKNMILIPSNLDIAHVTCGSGNCHSEIFSRVNSSIMNTMSGIISVDKWIFGETQSLNNHYNIKEISISPADLHLRNLCAGCHIGNKKFVPDTISQLSRGGGCSACHLNYDDSAKKELTLLSFLKSKNQVTKFHPDINIKTNDSHCFGCHSRSGRTSLNYMGLAEDNTNKTLDWIELEDGRKVIKVQEDIHHKAALMCIDCHISSEIMGDGKKHFHKEDALKISCEDCHPKSLNTLQTEDFSKLDRETQLIVALRKIPNKDKFLKTNSSENYYPNVIKRNGKLIFISKNTNKQTELKIQSDACYAIKGHNELDCKTCHTSWSPNCISCHTYFDPKVTGWDNLTNSETKGSWIEQEGRFFNDSPTLGVVIKNGIRKVTTFSPGMIINLNKSINSQQENVFHRLYSPVSPHTISKSSRSCNSCHFSPNAIGYGRGKLEFKLNKISFIPDFFPSIDDGLPQDAWIKFLSNTAKHSTTRENAKPFNIDEQKKILSVGVCLSCHNEKDNKLKVAFNDFNNFKKYISKKCKYPIW